MLDEQRPWLRIDSVSVKNFHIEKEEIIANIVYSIANVGRRPAVKIFARDELSPSFDVGQIIKGNPVQELCLKETEWPWTIKWGESFKSLGVGQSRTAMAFPEGKEFVQSAPTGRYDSQFFLKFPSLSDKQQFILISCILYSEPASNTVRHTGLSIEISVKGPMREGQDIPETVIKSERPDFGWYNYAD
jgi:hypothetical protein